MKKVIKGTLQRPRLYVFRSNKHIYAQIIDDTQNKVLLTQSSLLCKSNNQSRTYATCSTSKLVGKLIAEDCLKRGISQVIFDRGNKLYHGRIKALAESARQEGIHF
uniref:Large ribosomal subunit protein uL18c n=1 Tax=Titanophycus setchellii TaxID=940129 RepID=A0A1G4NYB3_9FLOR|nr:Ribosomal protein L18 [Titanophycus setchellii]SCW23648.1 Ribosomal protein L18 [Titanophycus setchellii]